METGLLTISEFARRCGTSRRQVYRWIQTGQVRAVASEKTQWGHDDPTWVIPESEVRAHSLVWRRSLYPIDPKLIPLREAAHQAVLDAANAALEAR